MKGGPAWTAHFLMARKIDPFPYVWRLPLLIWQGAFFVVPLIFMAAMSFWLVKNYRMEPALRSTTGSGCWVAGRSGMPTG
jgi:hypothetical protein